MSWQSYVDDQLIKTGKVTRAAILGQAGGVWAKSSGYELSSEEQKALIGFAKNLNSALTTGIRLRNHKFFVVQVTDRSLYCKKQADGATIVVTKQAILVTEYDGPLQAGESAPVVEKLADYLINAGF